MVIGTEIMTINNELSMSKSALHTIRIAYERWMRQGAKNNRISLRVPSVSNSRGVPACNMCKYEFWIDLLFYRRVFIFRSFLFFASFFFTALVWHLMT